jgi:hypothetical protein
MDFPVINFNFLQFFSKFEIKIEFKISLPERITEQTAYRAPVEFKVPPAPNPSNMIGLSETYHSTRLEPLENVFFTLIHYTAATVCSCSCSCVTNTSLLMIAITI